MVSGEDKKALEKQHSTLVLVWAGFLGALVSYLLLPQFASHFGAVPGVSTLFDVSRMTLWTVVAVIIAVLWWWKQTYLTKEALLTNHNPKRGTRMSQYAMRKIVAFTLAEAIAVYGLILGLLGDHLWDQLGLSLIAGLLLTYLYPSRAFLEEIITAMEAQVDH